MKTTYVLQDLIQESKDGEWGKGEPFDGSVQMVVVRATDFEDVQFGRPLSVPVRFIPPAIAARKTLQLHDIIIETAGGGKDRPTGRTQLLRQWFVTRSPLPITCASFCRFLRIDPAKAEPIYVYWLLQHMYAAGFMKQFHTQHTGVARFQYTTFATTQKFSLPSRSTQRKIAAVLSAYDDLIENNTRRIAILEEMAQAIYREWFVHFRFPGHENVRFIESPLGKIPEGWVTLAFSQSADFVNGFAFKPEHWGGEGKPIIKIAELKNGVTAKTPRHSGDGIPDKYTVNTGDVLFSWSADLEAYIWPHEQGLLNQHLFTVLPSSGFTKQFLYFALRHRMPEFRNLSLGTTMRHIKRSALDHVSFVCPPPHLRNAFTEHALSLIQQVIVATMQVDVLRKTRDLLLPKLISGELDVEDLDIETGENAVADASGSDLVCSEAVREGAGRSEPQASTPPRKKQS